MLKVRVFLFDFTYTQNKIKPIGLDAKGTKCVFSHFKNVLFLNQHSYFKNIFG